MLSFTAMETTTTKKPTVTITLPAPALQSVRQLARMNARSLSNQMARLVEIGLERVQPTVKTK